MSIKKKKRMATPRILCSLIFDTALTRDTFDAGYKTEITGKSVKMEINTGVVSESKNPGDKPDTKIVWSTDARFTNAEDASEIFSYIKSVAIAPAITGKISIHNCTHSNGKPRTEWQDCRSSNYQVIKI